MLEAHPEQLPSFPTLRSGRYIISGVLGKGGNARVYQAWDTTLRAWRAIKVLSPEFITNDQVRARFAQEAATMARLDHPNLVKVYDISDDPFTPHIVMELCEGGAIIDWMKEHGAVPPKLALRVIGEIALAVQAVHEEGIIHRDIKPQNILIDQYGIAKLTDFGIARDTDNSLTMAGATMGTYAFMAPEQRHDSTSVDVRTDIYSLGATLFTLTRVKTTTELFIAEADDPLFETLPGPLVEFILRTCSYRPRDRFQSIDTFLTGLKTLTAALPDDPETTPPIQALARSLPVRPPDDLPDLEQLEDLLKALALNEGYAHTTGGTSIEQTTLGASTAPFAMLRDRQLPPPQAVSTRPIPPAAPALFAHHGGVQQEASQQEEALSPLTSQPLPSASFAQAMPTGLMLAGGVASVIAALLSAILIYGVVAVGGAASDVRRAEHDLVTTVIASSPILQSLEEGQQLKELYIKVQDGSPHEAARDARLYASALDHALLIAAPKGDAIHLAQNVLNANERVESSEQRWTRAASSPAGLFATALGLAEAP